MVEAVCAQLMWSRLPCFLPRLANCFRGHRFVQTAEELAK